MAVKCTHGLMKNKGMPAALFFNVHTVRLDNLPSRPYVHEERGRMTTGDLYPGVNAMGGGANAASQPDTRNLSY
jgi:hypothetical protein